MAENSSTSIQVVDRTPDSEGSPTAGGVSGRTPHALQPTERRGAQLRSDMGKTSIADSVVAKISGLATREVSGVHDMGTGGSRMFGSLKSMLPLGNDQPAASQGVSVEVGERQAAIDLDVVIEYGASIVDVAQAIRRNVIGRVENMTGLEVTEVNISVDDVWLGAMQPPSEPRVQ